MDDFFEDERIGFAGDWHGNTEWALAALMSFSYAKVRVIYHLGDFGFWGGENGAMYLRRLNRLLTQNNQMILAVPGNHENYDLLDTWPINDEGFLVNPDYPLIWAIPRGHAWLQGGARFAGLGGAFSIDIGSRTPGVSWWPQEFILPENVEALENNLDALNWDSVDVFLSHDTPEGAYVGKKEFILPPELEKPAEECRRRLRLAVDRAKPKSLVHGHWHKFIRTTLTTAEYQVKITGLDCDGFRNNLMIANVVAGVGLTDEVFT